ncbi:PDZ domain-containing protein [Bremerella cremea]|uniref:PDZ domain-containing protein n=1 Tax=Bremerella cremea TaxID=1031537 RepID=UPI0013142524|nr:PDZ domain-containing protein [Bremerella cremea]
MAVLLTVTLLMSPQGAQAQGALDKLNNLLDQVQGNRQQPPANPQPTPATNERPFLGAMLDTYESDSDPILKQQGIIVTEINPGGPADKAGLKPGDLIVTVDGQRFQTLDQLGKWMSGKKPGDKLTLNVLQDGKPSDLEVVLGSQSNETPVPPPLTPPGQPYDPLGVEGNMPQPEQLPAAAPVAGRRVLGVRVLPVDDQLRAQTGISVRRGAFVESVSRGGVADQAGIPVGAVIVAYDGRRVNDANELIQMVRTSPEDRWIPVNYYVGNRMESTNLFYGDPRTMPPQPIENRPSGPSIGEDRPALRLLQNAIQGMEGNAVPADQMVTPEQVESLSRRVRELEQEVRQLREELKSLKSGGADL